MTSYTNHTAGARGINISRKDAITTRWLEPGETLDLDEGESVSGDLPDLGKPADEGEVAMASLAEANVEIARLRARVAELEGGQQKRSGLTGKGKDALLKIAADEGVDKASADDGSEIAITDATNAQIVQAIEAKREG